MNCKRGYGGIALNDGFRPKPLSENLSGNLTRLDRWTQAMRVPGQTVEAETSRKGLFRKNRTSNLVLSLSFFSEIAKLCELI